MVGEGDEWTVYWVDTSVMMERVMDMKRYQVRWNTHTAAAGTELAVSVSAEDQPFPRNG